MPVFFGAIVGILGFLPLFFCLKMTKKATKTSNLGSGAILMLGVVASLFILIVFVLICYFCFRDTLVAFALACAITLIVVSCSYGIYTVVRRNKAAEERKK